MDKEKIERAVRDILEAIGEDPKREGLLDTPRRVANMYEEIFSAINKDPSDDLQVFFEQAGHEELVLVKDIPFYSCCEHHLVPFFGKAHIGYIPRNGKITGLSKLARVVDTVAKKPQLQERLTTEIVEALEKQLNPLGVIVVVEAEHMCMTMRGIKKPGSRTITSGVRGAFQSDAKVRAEALQLIKF
ncbi:GTP cyclohydrolase I FolE [Thiospirochaeta perfilievii]|uniref:GTP cyclohydrolase 1 n=1 Tax=Thiospirochaeta perfilievii TaxID=252967 RepID=A0A5C1Q7K8_9SPIO|nr:GTP cyclohydrolase I FolE [Thiospirochaeta perfilievii]QEN04063.1 GTP cyclohydrolase I FolE [Thiospirochaeta perfilievii]